MAVKLSWAPPLMLLSGEETGVKPKFNLVLINHIDIVLSSYKVVAHNKTLKFL